MAKKPVPEIDDELFDEVYGKAYTGPPGLTANNDKLNSDKRPNAGTNNAMSDEEDEPHDPNAVPTDFTSREAKAWVARAKATERNWKKRKEEEMICKICGESGHFTQGCPSTLGASRKSQDLFQRVPARDKHVRALFTEKVIHRIERDAGCKIKMDEKFIIVSGKDNSCLTKGLDAVHKVIQDEGKTQDSSTSHRARSRSPDRSPAGSQLRRSESYRSNPSPRKGPHVQLQPKAIRSERVVEDHLREDLKHMSRRSPQAYGNDGARGRSSHSKSPQRSTFTGDAYRPYDGHIQNIGVQKTDGWDVERRGADIPSSRKFDYPAYAQRLEELEMEFKREAMELGRIRDKEEDEENYKHRETIRELRESYMKKLAMLRGMQAKQWEEFLQFDIQRQQRAHQHMSASSYNTYNHPNYSEYDQTSGNPHYSATNVPMESRGRYPYTPENYPSSRPHDTYGEFSRQRHEDFGKTYNRY